MSSRRDIQHRDMCVCFIVRRQGIHFGSLMCVKQNNEDMYLGAWSNQ